MRTLSSALRAAAIAAALTGAPAGAQELKIAFEAEWTAIDPHFHSFPHNLSLAQHVFDTLVTQDSDLRLVPLLAESWRAVDDRTWEFTLRRGVKFHDGGEFTAADVVATLTRIPKVPNSPGPVTTFIRPIESWEVKDPYRIHFKTKTPDPNLPVLLTNIHIIPARLVEATTEDFNSGRAAVGTGPYRFVEWQRGQGAVLERNDAYWGARQPWRKVEIRVITNTAAREAALLSGGVDFILSPSTVSLARLESDPRLLVHKAASTRITYLNFAQGPQALPDLKGTDGRNPFADARVRRAFSLAIPREQIAERIMDGLALPAGQLVSPGHPGHNPAIAVPKLDPDQARRLLAEAGWDKGFEVTLSTPNDRNINGVKIVQAIAAALTRINVKTAVNAVPLNVYLGDWRAQKYSFYMHGAGPPPATILLLPQLAATKDMKTAMGVSNESGYSNPALDTVLAGILSEIDDGKRQLLVRQATETIEAETPVIPLHYETVVWASRKGLAFKGRGDTRTHAMDIRPAS